jgi:hypothetical protein
MTDSVRVAGQGDINRVLPYIERHREHIGVSADRSRRQIGSDVEESIRDREIDQDL